MALSLGEMVAAARLNQEMPSVTDRWQNGFNSLMQGIGQIYGSKWGSNIGQMGQNMGKSLGDYVNQIRGGK